MKRILALTALLATIGCGKGSSDLSSNKNNLLEDGSPCIVSAECKSDNCDESHVCSPSQVGSDLGSDLAKPCYRNSFASAEDLADLVIQTGYWHLNENALETILYPDWAMAYLNNQTYGDFVASVKLLIDSYEDNPYLGLVFRYNRQTQEGFDLDVDQGYCLQLASDAGKSFRFVLSEVYRNGMVLQMVDMKYAEWNEIGVSAIGSEIKGYFNGQLMFTHNDDKYTNGYIGFGSLVTTTGQFKDLEVCPQ